MRNVRTCNFDLGQRLSMVHVYTIQLQELREDLRQRESRWGSAQSRLRLRIQSLEKENQELCTDLKMMEQTRLQLWQKQVRVYM